MIERESLQTHNPEQLELLQTLKEFPELGKMEIKQIEDQGWCIECLAEDTDSTSFTIANTLSLDLDDLLINSIGAKGELVKEMEKTLVQIVQKYLIQVSLDLTDIPFLATKLTQITDLFARWIHQPDHQEPTYHLDAQIAAIEFVLNEFDSKLAEGKIPSDFLIKLEKALGEISFQNRSKFNLHNPYAATAVQLVERSLLKPAPNSGVVETVRGIIKSGLFEVAIFSGGEPNFQLKKILHFLKAHPDIQVKRIFLSKGSKGNFLTTALAIDLFKTSVGNQRPAHFVHLDDDPKVANSLAGASSNLKENLAVAMTRLKLPRGKSAKKDWEPLDANSTQIDVSQSNIDTPEFVSKLLAAFWQHYVKFCKANANGVDDLRLKEVTDYLATHSMTEDEAASFFLPPIQSANPTHPIQTEIRP